jgi:hypothetical protein
MRLESTGGRKGAEEGRRKGGEERGEKKKGVGRQDCLFSELDEVSLPA